MGVLLCLLLVVNGGEFREEVHSSFQMAVSSSWFEGVIRGLDRHLGEEGLSFVPSSFEDAEEVERPSGGAIGRDGERESRVWISRQLESNGDCFLD